MPDPAKARSLPDQRVCTACRGAKTFPPMDLTDDDYVCRNCDGTGVEPEPEPELLPRAKVEPVWRVKHTVDADKLDLIERTRRRMVELSIPAGADPAQLVQRIGEEMAHGDRLRAEVVALRELYTEENNERERLRAALAELYAAGFAMTPHLPPIAAKVCVRWDDAMGVAAELAGASDETGAS